MCFPLSLIDKNHLEEGNNIIMPASALSRSSQRRLVCRMTFRITKSNDTGTLHYHCGVAEFAADEGFVFLPTWVMKKLKIREGDLVNVKETSLPEGNYIKVQPRTTKFVTLSDHKLVLEKALRDNVACLTTGDIIVVNHDHNKYLIHIIETKPSRVVSLLENENNEVEFAIPLDYYKQPWLEMFPGQWSGAILQGYDTIYQSMKKFMIRESTVANKQQTDECKPFTRKVKDIGLIVFGCVLLRFGFDRVWFKEMELIH
nr:ubiquitin fusion degradation protein UFD1 [Tanacetum cinerariifolium]